MKNTTLLLTILLLTPACINAQSRVAKPIKQITQQSSISSARDSIDWFQEKARSMDMLTALSSADELKNVPLTDEKREEMLSLLDAAPRPHYSRLTAGDKEILSVFMREELILKEDAPYKYVGTMGLGPCIALGIVAKKEGKVIAAGVTHIDALTQLESLGGYVWRISQGADELDAYLISSGYQRDLAASILEKITRNPDVQKIIKIYADIAGPSSMAISVETGEIFSKIPLPKMLYEEITDQKAKTVMFPSGLRRSSLYNLLEENQK